jgi:hypothetical protein
MRFCAVWMYFGRRRTRPRGPSGRKATMCATCAKLPSVRVTGCSIRYRGQPSNSHRPPARTKRTNRVKPGMPRRTRTTGLTDPTGANVFRRLLLAGLIPLSRELRPSDCAPADRDEFLHRASSRFLTTSRRMPATSTSRE